MGIRYCLVRLSGLILAAAVSGFLAPAQELPNLPPITPQDLKMTDNPAAPGGNAMILHYAVESDNTKWTETYSVRIKVLKEEGKKYADVEFPYYDQDTKLEEVRARSISPDGKVTDSTGQIFDREVVKSKKYHVNEKVLTLPNVQVGSIIEYSYQLRFKEKLPDAFKHPEGYILRYGFTWPAANWAVQQYLFVRHAEFRLIPVKDAHVRDFYLNVSERCHFARLYDGSLQYSMDNIPAYEEEDFAPPEKATKMRLDLYYAVGFTSPEDYWRDLGMREADELEKFIGKSKAIQQEAARIVAPNASQDAKARAIYQRVQKIRAVSFEDSKTDKEMKQENLRENKHAEDVLRHNYAYANEINLLYVALARAAGLQVAPMRVTARNRSRFLKDYPYEGQLNAMVVVVNVDGKSVFLDPATRFCPYGLLPWDETDAGGIVIDSLAAKVAYTPVPLSLDAVTRIASELQLNEGGGLDGNVTVSFSGQEALSMRLDAIHKDETKRREELEKWLQDDLMQGATAKLVDVQGWEASEQPLKATFQIDIPNFATQTGKRLILPLSVFHENHELLFATSRRTQLIYFDHPAERHEVVKILLPPEIRAETLPGGNKLEIGAVSYERTVKNEGNTLVTTRKQILGGYAFKKEAYLPLRDFYGRVQAADAEQITLTRQENAKINPYEKPALEPAFVQGKQGEAHP